jgi:transposase
VVLLFDEEWPITLIAEALLLDDEDNTKANKSKAVKEFAALNNIKLHYLPTYSPNLNPIERLWKVRS